MIPYTSCQTCGVLVDAAGFSEVNVKHPDCHMLDGIASLCASFESSLRRLEALPDGRVKTILGPWFRSVVSFIRREGLLASFAEQTKRLRAGQTEYQRLVRETKSP